MVTIIVRLVYGQVADNIILRALDNNPTLIFPSPVNTTIYSKVFLLHHYYISRDRQYDGLLETFQDSLDIKYKIVSREYEYFTLSTQSGYLKL